MSTFSDACRTGWDLYRREISLDDWVKDWVAEKFGDVTSSGKNMPDEVRFQHMLATGRSGCGKSSYLYGLMAKDIPECLARMRTLIVIDPVNGIDKIVNETNIAGRTNVFLIDPADPDSLPRLNLFETGLKRHGLLATTHTINTFKSVCAGLIDQGLSPQMMTFFGYCARVLMLVENRTLHDLMDLMREPLGYMQDLGIDEHDPIYQFFVEDVVGAKGGGRPPFAETVKHVRNRVHGFLNDPIIERLLINKNPTLSISKAIESGSIILVATRKTDVGEDGCRLIGKFIKSMINRVAQERVHAPDISRAVPIFFYEDEFQNSLVDGTDDQLATMLDENRKFKLSINLATTRFGRIKTDLGDAIMQCTASKVCGTMVSKGAAVIAQELGRTTEELKSLPNYTLFVKSGSDQTRATRVKSPKDPFKKFKNDPRGMHKLRARMNAAFGQMYVERRPATEARSAGAIEDVEM